ncbi:MAG TPA: GTPase Era [Pseudogracilibacillus sp.]|nr:GTPase Era [Pseudogracilibacillus sp.]
MNESFKSGFATMIGRPNVGKSTLLNYIIGEKISIISDKIQTTRQAIQGVYSDTTSQIIFVDTPGIHKPKHQLGSYMVDVSLETINDVDVVLFLVSATDGLGKGDAFIIEKLKATTKPVFLLINKVDLIQPDDIFPLIEQYKAAYPFEEIIPLSALNGNNVSTLVDLLSSYLPKGPQLFSDEEITNRSVQFLISELIREKALHHTEEEVPHSVNVIVDSMDTFQEHKRHIQATIVIERSSQKGIIIGKQGKMLKRIGREARKDIEILLDEKVYLELWVKVQKDWRNRPSLLQKFGFNELN